MLYPRESATREVVELGGFWEFAKDPGDIGVKKRWFAPRGVDAGAKPPTTRPVAVRASYNEQTADGDLWEYFGAVWYFRRFVCPASWKGRRIVLRFAAVHYEARVWLDGKPLVRNRGGSLPFEADVTRRVTPGRESLVAVRVDSTLSRTTIPPTLPWKGRGRPFEYYFDFLNMSGIHRPVKLYSTGRTYLKDISAVPSITGRTGIVKVALEVAGRWDRIRLEILDAGGRVVLSKDTKSLNARLRIPRCRFWCPEDPYLYALRVSIHGKGELLDAYSLAVGVRTVRVKGDKFLLNGKPVYFKGASRHEDFPTLGRGMNEAVLVRDFALMKWMGANSFRTVHYPHAEEALDLADRLGFMVINETPAVGMNDWIHKIFKKGVIDEKTRRTHMEMLERQYERDKNHPCVVMWSLADEPASSEPAFIGYVKPLFRRIRELDGTRPVSFATTAHYYDEKAALLCDVILLNRYLGWYQRTGQLDGIDEELPVVLDEWHRRFKRPIILEEFGADTVEGFHHHPPIVFSEEYQLELVKRFTRVMDSKPFVIGEHVWVMFDFATKQSLMRVGGNRKGIFTRSRQPKTAAHFLRERWSKK